MNCTGKNCIMQYDKVDPTTCPCVQYCPQATPPKTNADCIRSMSDEKLAELFSHLCCPYSLGGKVDCNAENKGCKACWLKWLQEETKDGSI